ncbi:MAG: hypothetical protein AAFZ17_10070 [Cyanobacteria bacterium J06650_10]
MPQLSKPKTDVKSRQANLERTEVDSQSNGKGQSSEWTKLGYEVFNKRRVPSVQVPLNVSNSVLNTAAPSSYTGSALLDSFIRDRSKEASALQTLRLVNVENSLGSTATPSVASVDRDADTLTSDRPVSPELSSTELSSSDIQPLVEDELDGDLLEGDLLEGDLLEGNLLVDQVDGDVPEGDAVQSSSTNAQISAEDEAFALAKEAAQDVEVQELLVEIQEPIDTQEQSPAVPARLEQDVLEQDISEQDISEQPPTEAEPETLDAPPALSLSPSAQPKPASSPRHTPAPAARSVPAFSAAADHEKRARDSAASVGLIDITDTLLFGGDRPDLVSTDPFIAQGNETNSPAVLSYLTKQISAFTVDRLQSGFPHNTDPRVINRSDPPKRKTVLDIENFELGQLEAFAEEPKKLPAQEVMPQESMASQEAADISMLSQQVEDLNRKIAYLSQKLAQVADTAG